MKQEPVIWDKEKGRLTKDGSYMALGLGFALFPWFVVFGLPILLGLCVIWMVLSPFLPPKYDMAIIFKEKGLPEESPTPQRRNAVKD